MLLLSKYWRALNLAILSKTVRVKFAEIFNLAVRQMRYIKRERERAEKNLLWFSIQP